MKKLKKMLTSNKHNNVELFNVKIRIKTNENFYENWIVSSQMKRNARIAYNIAACLTHLCI